MLNGNDTILLDALFTVRKVTVNGGDGNNVLTVQNGQIGGVLSITNGDAPGTCAVTIVNEHLGQDLKIANRSGASAIALASGTRIGGSVSITNGSAGAGSHSFVLSVAEIVKGLTISNANGASNQTLAHALVGGDVRITNGVGVDTLVFAEANLKKALTVNLGDGDSHVTFASALVGGNVSCGAGAGVDSVNFSSCTVGGSLAVALGAVASTFSASLLTVGKACAVSSQGGLTCGGSSIGVGGALSLHSGVGDLSATLSMLTVKGNATFTSQGIANTCTLAMSDIDGKLSYAGAGASVWTLADIRARSMTYAGGDGADTVSLTRVNLGNLTANLGNGDNSLSLDGSAIVGDASVQAGSGLDTVTIATNSSAISFFGGKTKILLGDGNDVLTIGEAGNPQHLAIFSKTSLFDGQAGTNTGLFLNAVYGGPTSALHFA